MCVFHFVRSTRSELQHKIQELNHVNLALEERTKVLHSRNTQVFILLKVHCINCVSKLAVECEGSECACRKSDKWAYVIYFFWLYFIR